MNDIKKRSKKSSKSKTAPAGAKSSTSKRSTSKPQKPKKEASKQEIERFLKAHKQNKPKVIQEEKAHIGFGKTVLILLAALIVGALGSTLTQDVLFPWLLAQDQFSKSEFLQKATEQTTVIQNTREVVQEQQDTSAREAITKAQANIVGVYQGTTFIDSGFVLTTDGLIIAPTTAIAADGTYTVKTKRGTSLPATIVSHNSAVGLALLQVEASDLAVTTLAGTEGIEPGDTALALAHVPSARQSLAAHVVNIASIRTVQLPEAVEAGLLQPSTNMLETTQTTASAPFLFNLRGELTGIQLSATQDAARGSQFIDIEEYRALLSLATTQKQVRYPITGFQAVPLTEELAAAKELSLSQGLLVTSVVEEGPAALAELAPDDIITAINSEAITTDTTLSEYVKTSAPKDTLVLDIARFDEDGNRTDLQVSIVLQ